MVTTTADLNLHPDLNGNVKIFCSQYDNALREIVFTIYDGENLADLTGLTATVEGTKPDKYGYSYDATINTTNSTVTVTLVTQMTCVAGISHVEIVLYSGSYRVGTANFLLMVEEAGLSDDTIVSDSVIPGIHNIDVLVGYAQTYADNAEASALEAEGYAVGTQNGTEVESGSEYYENNAKYYCEHAFSTTPEGYEALVNQVSNTKSVIGSSYNASTNYAAGDRFTDNGVRYKVNVPCIGITPPNANYYEVISVDEDTKELESNISTLNSSLTNLSERSDILGAKNLLPNLLTTSKTSGGVTATPNDDGTISLSGQFTSQDSILLTDSWHDTNVEWLTRYEGQSVILSGGITGVNLSIWGNDSNGNRILFFDSGYVGGESSAVTIPSGIVDCAVFIYPQSSSVDADGTTLYPMLRLATDSDSTYQPYAMTNQELTSSLMKLNSKTITTGQSITTSVSAATWTDILSITLEAGTYIINAGTTIRDSEGKGITIRYSNSPDIRQSLYCPDNNAYSANVLQPVGITSSTTIYVSAWCASAVTISTSFIQAIRLDADL